MFVNVELVLLGIGLIISGITIALKKSKVLPNRSAGIMMIIFGWMFDMLVIM